jgi:hypothetical protein
LLDEGTVRDQRGAHHSFAEQRPANPDGKDQRDDNGNDDQEFAGHMASVVDGLRCCC